MKLEDIDKNFKVETKIEQEGLYFLNSREEPFRIYGVEHSGGKFRRCPEEVAKSVSDNVNSLHRMTAGGRVRFKTNSLHIAINAKMPMIYRAAHFPMTGSSGFDMFVDGLYSKTFVPPHNMTDGYESIYRLDGKMHDIEIFFPLYNEVSELFIGLIEGSEILRADDYRIEKPMVFYGSSITQGGCASRPSMSYEAILSRRFNANFLNLGFSGSAKGEIAMAEYIAGLDMSVYVSDYDHNTPSLEHLRATHEKFIMTIREKNPDLPIIILPNPKYLPVGDEFVAYGTDFMQARCEIVKETYENMINRGDKNVYFVENAELNRLCGSDGTVDGCHPTDLGFVSMAEAIGKVLEKIFQE